MTEEELKRWEEILLGEGPVHREDRRKLFEILKALPKRKPSRTSKGKTL